MKSFDELKDEIRQRSPKDAKMVAWAETMAKLQSAIIGRRDELGLSTKELGERIGISGDDIFSIECGVEIEALDNFVSIVNELGLEITITPKEA